MMNKIIYLILILIVMTSFIKRDDVYISFPSDIGIIKNCIENKIIIKFELITDSKKKIEVESIKFNNQEFILIINEEKRRLSDTLFLSESNPLEFEIQYERKFNKFQDILSFKTDKEENLININYGEYNITSEAIRNGNNQVFNFVKSCNDSLVIHFPYGGTVSGVRLFKDSIVSNLPCKSLFYGFMDKKNYLKFSKRNIGRYYVRFNACHWGNNFWLTIE